jgi:hypothetical protein
MSGTNKVMKKRAPKKAGESSGRENIRHIVDEILRSMADDKIVGKAPKKETLMKRADMNNMRESIGHLEANVNAQFVQVDQKLNTLKAMIDEIQMGINKKNEQWEHELRSCIASVGDVHEKDKAKTLKTLQKMHARHEADIEDTRNAVREVQKLSNESIHAVKDTMKSIAKEVSHNKDAINDM